MVSELPKATHPQYTNLQPFNYFCSFSIIKANTPTVGTPNPMKVEAVLLELELPYEMKDFDMSVLHTPVYEKYNPNGRVPALIDPNNGDFTIWESGAIIEYLIDTYDQAGKISHPSGNEKYLEKQWLHFQMSGQGPYCESFLLLLSPS